MAALGLLVVTLWLYSTGRKTAYAFYPMIFMYVTTMAAIIVTGYNLYASILSNPKIASQRINLFGAAGMIVLATLLFVAALLIAYDSWAAWRRMRERQFHAPAVAAD